MRKYHTLRLLSLATVAFVALFGSQQASAATYNDWDGSDLSSIAASSANATWTETNTVFLYNVGKKAFLNRGGNWGTQAVLSNVGMEFLVVKNSGYYSTTYSFVSNFQAEGGGTPYLGAGTNQDAGFYVDQTQLSFTPTQTSVEGKTCYRLAYTSNRSTYYMCGADDSSLATGLTVSKETSTQSDNSDLWIFVTVKEREQKFAKADMDEKVEVPATFMMKDNDFARRSNTDVAAWKDASGNALSNSYTSTTPSSQSNGTYYVGNGNVDDSNGQSGTLGEKWTGNFHGASGEIKQSLTDLFRHGWYEIRCRAFSTSTTTNPYLYASVDGQTVRTKAKSDYMQSNIQTGVSAPSTYTAANDVVNAKTTINGEDVYSYQLVVRVYVEATGSKDESTGKETCQSLTFGVKTEGGAASDWLCVDNYEIYYIGEGGNEVVLDETQPDITYMNEQIQAKNSTIYLNRSLSADTWNTIVLPFDMDAYDITYTFGSGTLLSKYKGAEEGDQKTIHFEKAATIEKGKLYIIKPLFGEPEPNLTATSTTDNLTTYALDEKTGVKTENAKGKLSLTTKYYTIPNIVYGSKDEDGNNVEFTANVEDNSAEVVSGGSIYQFTGTYTKQLKVVPEGAYMLKALSDTEHTYSTGTWQYRTKAASSLGFRGWLAPVNDDAKTQSLSFVIDGVEDQTTSIDGISAQQMRASAKGIYNLNGQRVAANAQQLNTLPKGLYIVNGKKVVVK